MPSLCIFNCVPDLPLCLINFVRRKYALKHWLCLITFYINTIFYSSLNSNNPVLDYHTLTLYLKWHVGYLWKIFWCRSNCNVIHCSLRWYYTLNNQRLLYLSTCIAMSIEIKGLMSLSSPSLTFIFRTMQIFDT